MVRHRVLAVGILVWVVVAVAAVAAAQQEAGADPVSVAEALAELDEAGTPPTTEEIADFLAAAATPMRGAVIGRVSRAEGGNLDRTGRLHLSRSWWEVRLRWRRDQWGRREVAGAVGLGNGNYRLVAGQLGLRHGFGLLVGGSGRGPTLTADGSLSSRTPGLRSWVGPPQPQTVVGAGVEGGWAGWRVRALIGRRGTQPAAVPPTALGQFSRESGHWQVSVALISDPLERGVSVAGRLAASGLSSAWETVWRRPEGGGKALGAVLLHGAWRVDPRLRLAVLAGWSDLGPRPPMGVKHPVLGDWSGQGVAIRGTWRLRRGLGIQALIHQAASRQEIVTGNRRRKILSDVQVDGTGPGGWFAGARVRSGGQDVAAWSERFPWQPPKLAWRDRSQVVSVKAGQRRDRSRIQLLWRRLQTTRVRQGLGWEKAGARSLLSLSGRSALGGGWLLRAAWTMAWGDEADLVSAVVPFSGYVLPRHWGHWRSECLLGVEFNHGPYRCRGAFSWREAELAPDQTDYADLWAAWLEGGWYW